MSMQPLLWLFNVNDKIGLNNIDVKVALLLHIVQEYYGISYNKVSK